MSGKTEQDRTAKKLLRKEVLRRAAAFTDEAVDSWSAGVCRRILESEAFRKADTVLGYLSFNKEISVDGVLREALRRGKTVAVPFIVSATEFRAARLERLDNLPPDRYGIRTVPEPCTFLSPGSIDLILVPGAGFTRDGRRMGRGAGYYDRFLPQTRGLKLGITCEALLCDDIPTDPWDCLVDGVLTEENSYDQMKGENNLEME